MLLKCRYCGKTADWIRMPSGVVSGVGPGIHVLDGNPRASREGDVSGMVFGIFQNFSCIDLNGEMRY